MSLSAAELARYSRHLLLSEVGAAGQERLRAARVLVVGAGGLGSPAALYLAASGIGTLGIVDCDVIEVSNLQRQVLFGTQDVGRPKARAASERLAALNPEISVVAHALELKAANVAEVVDQYDIVVDGCDRIATRYLVNDACVIFAKALVSAAIYRFEGQAMTYVPGRGPCYRCLFPDAAAGVTPSCAEAGVLGVLPGVLGAIQATEAIKMVLGIGELLVGRLLTYDALAMSFREFAFARRPDCAVCGDHPSIRVPSDSTASCEVAPPGLRRLTATELLALLGEPGRKAEHVQLVDVREPDEFAAGHLAGAVSIPLGQVERRVTELARDATIVFVCRSGVRSAQAAALAARQGVLRTAHLEGGLLAWAATVDASLHVP
jgi:molybdopterin/thiamine biosynthesis adenylyltransferase/rhodanese-related sulfurtransferase